VSSDARLDRETHELIDLGAVELSAKFRAEDVTASEILEASLARATEYNPAS
jgi:Asp-tRNA(Asn)/Glu-tRNA(Gln) amidotransferase A subunit family amidase